MSKIDKDSKNKIIEELINLRTVSGYSTISLVKHLKNNHNINVSRAYDYIRMAREAIGEFNYKINENILSDAIQKLENLYEISLRDGDKKTALDVQKELNKINQLYIQKLEIEANINIEQPLFGPDINVDDKIN